MRTALTVLALVVAAGGARAEPPKKIGTCAASYIRKIGTRFGEKLDPKAEGDNNGTTFELENDTYGVSYEFVKEIYDSRVGDKVITCLVILPHNCPKGDDRGKVYTTTNLRTRASWTLPDAQHICGGA